jgi:ATP-dependent 26S proteasome regulatory subunit
MKLTFHSVLLYGPPGTGKKHLARAIAADIESKFINVNCKDIVSKWQSDGET